MSISVAGLLVCLGLLVLGHRLRAPLIVPMLVALSFGSTAVATLSSLGGSSPLIYVVFAAALLIATFLRRHLLTDLRTLFVGDWTAAVIVLLLIYVIGTSVILPRMFAGQTTAFVAAEGKVTEVMLAPTNGNITQVAYFTLGGLTYFTTGIALLQRRNFRAYRLGFFGFAIANAAFGLIDLFGKLSGSGDLLAAIRTASYEMLTGAEQAGFWRISGGFPEASAFAAAALACLGFAFGYWRAGGSQRVLVLMLVLLALILLSTSSTAYVACALMALPIAGGLTFRAVAGRLSRRDAVVLAIIAVCVVCGLAIAIVNGHVIEQIAGLFQSTLFDKAQSSSGQERSYWNTRSLASLGDTWGLGVGFGSSRASSWLVALVSQTGVVGALLVALPLLGIARGLRSRRPEDHDLVALYGGVRACIIAGLVGASVSGGNADPGLLFFVGLAVCNACRREVLARRPAGAPLPAAASPIPLRHWRPA
jgi:hypothetical protein